MSIIIRLSIYVKNFYSKTHDIHLYLLFLFNINAYVLDTISSNKGIFKELATKQFSNLPMATEQAHVRKWIKSCSWVHAWPCADPVFFFYLTTAPLNLARRDGEKEKISLPLVFTLYTLYVHVCQCKSTNYNSPISKWQWSFKLTTQLRQRHYKPN